jgi:RNA polymerase sigma factor (sigma-70 family)
MEYARSNPVLGGPLAALYNLGAAGTMTDGQLLDRFLARNDPAASEAAFTALIERHGAMVLGICRQFLGDSHDAHDAFQATFLVLVSKAGSIRSREAIGGWLFGIARRVAARAQAESARRRRHLRELFENQPVSSDDGADATSSSSEADYGPLIDAIDRLPEQLRSPVVLHYFEGLSTEATAQRLGCPRGTVLSRLSRARGRLKMRLEQQGISFAALLPVTDGINLWIPTAAVPTGLSHATIRAASSLGLAGAAIESVAPATVATLSRGVARTLLLSNIRVGIGLFALAVAGVSIGLAATSHSGDEPRQAAKGSEMPGPQRSQAAKSQTSVPQEEAMGDRFEYAGIVLDPDGKPVAGAKLHLAYWGSRGQVRSEVRGTTDAQGRFRFTVTMRDLTDNDQENPWNWAQVVAAADGFGIGWSASPGNERKVDPRGLTIRLARDEMPIEGRIVDLEGRPVAGAMIRPKRMLEPENGDLSAWISASKSGQEGAFKCEQEHLTRTIRAEVAGLSAPFTSDAEGRFSIRGIGRERVIGLEISGPTIQTKPINVLTRIAEPFRVNSGRRSPDWGISLYYGARFTHVAAPTKPVVGLVKDRDTGKPLAGVRIACNRTAEFPVHGFNGIETTTDRDGRYRLVGLPKGSGNQVIAIPAKGQPYLAAGLEIPDTPGLDPVTFDIGLKRGVVIEGRVTDKETGAPLKAFVEYNAFRDNPHLAEAPGFDRSHVWSQYHTEPDGTFHVVGLPGRGLVSAVFRGTSDQYLSGIGRDEDLRVVPNAMQSQFNAISALDLPKGATSVHRDLALERGIDRTIRVVDAEGRPVAGARIQGHHRVSNWSQPQAKAEFRVEAMRRGEMRRVHALLEERQLAGWVEVRADGQGTVELKLLPWATAVGRLVDGDGEPRAHIDLHARPGYDHPFQTDSHGRFHMEGLVPGLPMEVWVSPMGGFLSGKIAKGQVLAAGEIKDLGDVKEGRP